MMDEANWCCVVAVVSLAGATATAQGPWIAAMCLLLGVLVMLAAAWFLTRAARSVSAGNRAINQTGPADRPRVRVLRGVEPLADAAELRRGAKYLVTVPAHVANDERRIAALSQAFEECLDRMFGPAGDEARILLCSEELRFYEIVGEGE